MSRLDLLQKLNKTLSPDKVDFSGIDQVVEQLKKDLTDKVNIQTIEEVSQQIKQFQKKVNLDPILAEVRKIGDTFTAKSKYLQGQITDKTLEMETRGQLSSLDTKTSTELNSLRDEISALKTEHAQTVTDSGTEISHLMDLVKETETSMNQTLTERLGGLSSDLSTRATKTEIAQIKSELTGSLDSVKTELTSRLARLGGGSMNRQTFVGGNDALTKYSDINWKAGSNVTLTFANNNATKRAEITISSSGGGGGSTRSINSISTDTAGGATAGTDYVYICTSALTLTLPTAASNTNLYTVKNTGTGTILIATTGGETIDTQASIQLSVQYTSVDLISDGTNWNLT